MKDKKEVLKELKEEKRKPVNIKVRLQKSRPKAGQRQYLQIVVDIYEGKKKKKSYYFSYPKEPVQNYLDGSNTMLYVKFGRMVGKDSQKYKQHLKDKEDGKHKGGRPKKINWNEERPYSLKRKK